MTQCKSRLLSIAMWQYKYSVTSMYTTNRPRKLLVYTAQGGYMHHARLLGSQHIALPGEGPVCWRDISGWRGGCRLLLVLVKEALHER